MAGGKGARGTRSLELFRHPPTWDHLRRRVLPRFGGRRFEARCWCTGSGAAADALGLVLAWEDVVGERGGAVHILATAEDPATIERSLRAPVVTSRREWIEGAGGNRYLDQRCGQRWAGDEARVRIVQAEHRLVDPWPRQLDLLLFSGSSPGGGERMPTARCREALVAHGWLVLDPGRELAAGGRPLFQQIDELPLYLSQHAAGGRREKCDQPASIVDTGTSR